ncbi:Pfs domain protein [Aspergillus stella-maris]|uniref:Pfs domain protein n=1 Tax=Aspergillus stella-maris TaxID=1810926 RepID=UPI003CCDEC1F
MDTDMHEESETGSIYSDVSAISDSKMGYLSELADELVNVVEPYRFEEDVMRKVSNALPALLKAFALSLGHRQSTAMHREAMIMDLWKEREEATQYEPPGPTNFESGHFEGRYSGPMASSDPLEEDTEHLEDEKLDGQEGEEGEEREEPCERELPHLETYRKLIQGTPTYTWLLSGIRNECILYTPGRGISTEIRNAILEAFPVYARVSRRSSTETLNARFRIHWDPVYHVDNSLYEKSLERALTFTGSGSDLQAESCSTYMRRTWPSTGEAILQLLKGLASTEHTGTVTLADGTRVDISRHSSPNGGPLMDTLVNTRGTAACIAEIGEQLAWVASAIQTTRDEKTCICSKPFVKSTEAGHTYDNGTHQYHFEIGVEKYGLDLDSGRCWLGLVSRPAIVEGYPILRRPPDCPPGLEIQLGVIVHLLGTRKASRFYDKTVLKGFSTMLVPTRSKEEFVHWHFLEEKDDRRISYNRCMDFPDVDVSIGQLERARHIVGWCPEVRLYAGEIDANYNVSDSRLPRQDGLRILKNASLSLDHLMTNELSVSLGRKDVRVRRDGYMSKMKWIAGKYMTMWDSGEERGWFLNGATGLLHIVRASLERERSDPALRSAILLKPEDIHEAAETHRSHAALEVLLNIHNLNLRVYHVDADITFKNRVEDCYDRLEKMFDYQTIGLRKDQNVPRSSLEGWDFQDLAHERDPIYPRHTTLHEEGLSWVDFTRSINAITLFGRDFGQLMRPISTCSKSSALTPGKSFLAAAVSDLNKVMASNGDLFSTPLRLTRDTIWHVAESTSFPCLCEHSGQCHRTPAIQSLLPYSMRGELPARQPGNRGNNGAVIFGFDKRNKWFWGEIGPPSRRPAWLSPDAPMKESRSVYSNDSGLGRSLSSSEGIKSNASTGSSSHENQRQWQRLQVPASLDDRQEGRRLNSSFPMQYKIGIVCALHIELMAVRALFDVSHPAVRIPDEDPNYYVLGRIQGHNIVAVCLPHGLYGTSAATDVASHMRRSFTSLKFCLLVGIGAGVPSSKNDIRLGDVVVSTPSGHYSGVLPYDMVKSLEAGELQLNGYMSPPPQTLMCAISELESDPNLSPAPLEEYLREIQMRKPQYAHPGADRDQLFESDYHHPTENNTCEKCISLHTIERPPRLSHHQKIFYGLIASGNKLVRSAHERDKLGKEHNVLCIEMEGAGIMNTFPCLIIRGICDYADSHKNKVWQNYASAAAAAYAKLLLSRVRMMDDAGNDQGCRTGRMRCRSSGGL